jgi:hypothetical protein
MYNTMIIQAKPFIPVRFSSTAPSGPTKFDRLRALHQEAQDELRLSQQRQVNAAEESRYSAFRENVASYLATTGLGCTVKGQQFVFTGRDILDELLKDRDKFNQNNTAGYQHFSMENAQVGGKDDPLRNTVILQLQMPPSTHEDLNTLFQSLERLGFFEHKSLGPAVKLPNPTPEDEPDESVSRYQYVITPFAERFLEKN